MSKRNCVATALLLAMVALLITSCASTGASGAVPDEMQYIVEVPDKTKDELFIATNSWAVDTFNSAEAVIEFSDKDAGIIKGTFTQEISGFNNYMTETTITIESREGRARISFDDPKARMTTFMGQPTNPSAWPWGECNDDQLEELNALWTQLALDFEIALTEGPEEW